MFFRFPNSESFAFGIVEQLVKQINIVLSSKNICHIVLSGGRSPVQVVEILSQCDLSWNKLHFYLSDERCVPLGDPLRNDWILKKLKYNCSLLLSENLHTIAAELGPKVGALNYQKLLDGTPNFDIALLGVGDDGHIASLFPGHPGLLDIRSSIPVYNAPKPPSERVSLGMIRLIKSKERWIIITGSNKKELISCIKNQENLPVNLFQPTRWFVDESKLEFEVESLPEY